MKTAPELFDTQQEQTPAPLAIVGVDVDALAEHVRAIADAQTTAIEHAWHAGQLLGRAKRTLHHGQWGPWLARTGIPERTARRWIALARECSTIEEALARGSITARLKARPPEPQPAQIPLAVPSPASNSATVADSEPAPEAKPATVADMWIRIVRWLAKLFGAHR